MNREIKLFLKLFCSDKIIDKREIEKRVSLLSEEVCKFLIVLIPKAIFNSFTTRYIFIRNQFLADSLINRLSDKSYKRIINGLSNPGNSCYLDSTFISIFTVPNTFIDDNLLFVKLKPRESEFCLSENTLKSSLSIHEKTSLCLKNRVNIQNEIINIVDHIRGVKRTKTKDCRNLRSLFRNCYVRERYHGSGMKSPHEFLNYLFAIFNNSSHLDVCKIERKIFGSVDGKNWNETSSRVEYASIFQPFLDYEMLSNLPKDTNIQSLISTETLTELDEKNKYMGKYILKMDRNTILDSPYLIVSLDRGGTVGYTNIENKSYINKSIIPDEIIQLDCGRLLKLSAIVVYKGFHYTCYFSLPSPNNNKRWFYYNDIPNKIYSIGSYSRLLNQKTWNPKYTSVMIFYISLGSDIGIITNK